MGRVVAESPWGPSLEAKKGLGSSVVGVLNVWGWLSPITHLPPGLCWAFGGLATLSCLSQRLCPPGVPAGERRSGAYGGGTRGHGAGPPGSRVSSVPRVSPACLRCRRVPPPAPWRSMLSPTWRHDVPPQDPGDLTGSCIARARRAWRGTGTPRPWRAGGCADTLGMERGAERGWAGACARGAAVGAPPTLPHAAQGQGELAHEVVAGGAVVVLHHKAHQRQLGLPQLEAQRLLPARVEACGTGTAGECGRRGRWGHQGHLPPWV